MGRIVVVGAANIDRIWWLDRPLASGGRLFHEGMETRFGGGGFYTGGALLELGHEVALVTTLFEDDRGDATLKMLQERGFDTRHIARLPGNTVETEILVDPSGERTIIGRTGDPKPPVANLSHVDADAVYLNAWRLSAEAVEDLAGFPCVISQFPLRPGKPRPADTLIASRSDVTGPPNLLWANAVGKAGGRLSTLVVTDGAGPVSVIRMGLVSSVPVPSIGSLRDTTGAGNCFAAGYVDAVVRGLDAEAAASRGNEIAAALLTRRATEGQPVSLASMASSSEGRW